MESFRRYSRYSTHGIIQAQVIFGMKLEDGLGQNGS